MAHESFSYGETQPLFRTLEEVSQRAGVSRSAAFEDFLTAATSALAAETMEAEYLTMVERHKNGQPGKRSIDLISKLFAQLVEAMTRNDADILGDLFQAAISHQESGQFLTPESISKLLSELSIGSSEVPDDGSPMLISDPACGTGRMLIDAARQNPNVELFGQDIDARCVKICSINMGLRNLYGWVVCGNTLTCENRFAYRVAPFFHESPNGRRRGVIRDIPVAQTPALVRPPMQQSPQDLFASEQPAETSKTAASPRELPTIMEIPRWLSRVEHQLHTSPSSDSGDREVSAIQPKTPHKTIGNEESPESDSQQKTLF